MNNHLTRLKFECRGFDRDMLSPRGKGLQQILRCSKDKDFESLEIGPVDDFAALDGLPIFKPREINKFEANIKRGTPLIECLKSLPFELAFDRELVTSWSTDVQSGEKLSEVNIIVFLNQCLAWIVSDPEFQTLESLKLIITVLNATLRSKLREYLDLVFAGILKVCQAPHLDSIDVIETLMSHFVENPGLPSLFYPEFHRLITKHLSLVDSGVESHVDVIAICAKMLHENYAIFEECPVTSLVSLMSVRASELDVSPWRVICECSRIDPDNKLVSDMFFVVAEILFRLMAREPVQFGECMTNVRQAISIDEEGAYLRPSESMIESKCCLSDLIPDNMRQKVSGLVTSFRFVSSVAAENTVTSFARIWSMAEKSPHYFEFMALVLVFSRPMSEMVDVVQLIDLLWNDKAFDPKESIFSGYLMSDQLNALRNGIVEFTIQTAINRLPGILERYCHSPLLFAEILMRMGSVNGFPTEFYHQDNVNRCLVTALAACSVSHPVDEQLMRYSKVVIFAELFKIVHDPKSFEICISNERFVSEFFSLMFDEGLKPLIVKSLERCCSVFTRLPPCVTQFLQNIFKICTERHEDAKFTSIAKDVSQAVVGALAHNTVLAQDLDMLLDDVLAFMKLDATPEMLDDALVILMHICKEVHINEFSLFRFHALLNIIRNVEQDEPSDKTLVRIYNILGGSTNLGMAQSFPVENPAILPILIISFARSERLKSILEFLHGLCAAIESNAAALHDGDVDFLLLKALTGKFQYRCYDVDFEWHKHEKALSDIWKKLLTSILAVKSGYCSDRELLNLILPDTEGCFGEQAVMVSCILDSLFSSRPEKICAHPIASTTPLAFAEFKDPKSFPQLQNGFSIYLRLKIDGERARSMSESFVVLSMADKQNNEFRVWYAQSGLNFVCRMERQVATTQLLSDVRTNKWIDVAISIKRERGRWLVCFHSSMAKEVQFIEPSMSCPSILKLGYIEHGSALPMRVFPPVRIGWMGIYLRPFSSDDLVNIEAGNWTKISTEGLFISTWSSQLIWNRSLFRDVPNLAMTMRVHADVDKILRFFAKATGCAPERRHQTIMQMSNMFSWGRLPRGCFFQNIRNHFGTVKTKLDVDLSGVTMIDQNEYLSMSLSRLTAFLVILLVKSPETLTYTLYKAIYEMALGIRDACCIKEVFRLMILSIWPWVGSKNVLTHVTDHWRKTAIEMVAPMGIITPQLFTSLLVQFHLVCHSCGHDLGNIPKVRFSILEQIAAIAYDNSNTCAMMSIIHDLNRKHAEHKDEIIEYLQLFARIARFRQRDCDLDEVDSLILIVTVFEKDLFEHILRLFWEISGPNLKKRITQLTIKYYDTEGPPSAASNLDILCIQALYSKPSSFEFIREDKYWQQADKFFYFWPIIISLVYQEAQETVINLLLEQRAKGREILALLMLLDTWNIPRAKQLRDRYITGLLMKKCRDSYQGSAFLDCMFATFWKFRAFPVSPELGDELRRCGIWLEEEKEACPDSIDNIIVALKAKIRGEFPVTPVFDRRDCAVELRKFLPKNDDEKTAAIRDLVNRIYAQGPRHDNKAQTEVIYKYRKTMNTLIDALATSMMEETKRTAAKIAELLDDSFGKKLPESCEGYVGREVAVLNAFIEHGTRELEWMDGKVEQAPSATLCFPIIRPRILNWSNRHRLPRDIGRLRGIIRQNNTDELCEVEFFWSGLVIRTASSPPVHIIKEMIVCGFEVNDRLFVALRNCTVLDFVCDKTQFQTMCSVLNITIVTFSDLATFATRQWNERRISAFQYVLALNIREYLTLPTAELSFPSVDGDVPIAKAEIYFDIDKFGLRDVVANRKMLRSNLNLGKFGPPRIRVDVQEQPMNRYLPSARHLGSKKTRDGTVDFGGFIREPRDTLVFTFSGGSTFGVFEKKGNAISPIHITHDKCYHDSMKVAVGENYLVACDPEGMAFIKLAPDHTVLAGNLAIPVSALAPFGSSVVSVVDDHDIYIADACDFPLDMHPIFHEEERITSVVVDGSGIMALLTSSSKIIVVDIHQSQKLCEIFVGIDDVHGLCISKTCNCVLFQSGTRIYVFSFSGKQLHNPVDIFKPVTSMTVFTALCEIDYCAVVDSTNVAMVFNVSNPEEMILLGPLEQHVVSVYYDEAERQVLILDAMGHLNVYEFPVACAETSSEDKDVMFL